MAPERSTSEIIAEIASLKKGNREMVIHFDPDWQPDGMIEGPWSCGIGNPCSAVSLGESSPEIDSGWGPSLRAVLLELLDQVRNPRLSSSRD